MSSSGSSLKQHLSEKTDLFGLQLWVVISITVMILLIFILTVLVICINAQSRRRRRAPNRLPVTQIPAVSKEIREVRVEQVPANDFVASDGILLTIHDKARENDSDKVMVHLGLGKSRPADSNSLSGSFHHTEKEGGSLSGEDGNSGIVSVYRPASSSYRITAPSPLTGLPEFSHLGWGHWFTLRDLEIATNRFSRENILGEGGYGVVYHGRLINGSPVAVKRLLNNL